MSLDISLYAKETTTFKCEDCEKEHVVEYGEMMVFDTNITHNLGEMAAEAGLYKPLWRPEENGIERAKDLIEPLRNGIDKMENNPSWFKAFNAENGWGTYKQFLPWLKQLLTACEENPTATIHTSR